jgi:hypothetical protein
VLQIGGPQFTHWACREIVSRVRGQFDRLLHLSLNTDLAGPIDSILPLLERCQNLKRLQLSDSFGPSGQSHSTLYKDRPIIPLLEEFKGTLELCPTFVRDRPVRVLEVTGLLENAQSLNISTDEVKLMQGSTARLEELHLSEVKWTKDTIAILQEAFPDLSKLSISFDEEVASNEVRKSLL